MLIKSVIACVLALTLFSCSSTETTPTDPSPAVLPAENQTGTNTFGCKVDDVLFLSSSNSAGQGVNANYFRGTLLIIGSNSPANKEIRIEFDKKIFSPGSYDLSKARDCYYRSGSVIFRTDSLHSGLLTMTHLDTINKIVSGRFDFSGINYKGQVVKVTEGRFDIKY